MSSNEPPPVPPHGPRRQQVQWNSDQTDMSCHRLTAEQLSRKLASRQSHNLALARATLLSAGAQSRQPLTPALTARLRAATEQSLDSVIAECNAAVNNSQRIRQAMGVDAEDPPSASSTDGDSCVTQDAELSSTLESSNAPAASNGSSAFNSLEFRESNLSDEMTHCNGLVHQPLDGAARGKTPTNETSCDFSKEVRSSSAPPHSTVSSLASHSLTGMRLSASKLPLIATNGNGSNTNTYSSISSILRSKTSRTHSTDKKSATSQLSELLYRKGITSPGAAGEDDKDTSEEGPLASAGPANSIRCSTGLDMDGGMSGIGISSSSSGISCGLSGAGTNSSLSGTGTSSSGINSTCMSSSSSGLSHFQYTKNLEEARLEHEKELQKLKEECEVDSPPVEKMAEVLKITEQPNRNLDKTLQLVVSTCEALWSQLQQERQTRQQLQEHLQRQGAVIGDLTSELLQIQEQQEDILQEVQLARSSLLWQLSGADEGEGGLLGDRGLMSGDDGPGDTGRFMGASPLLAAMAESEERRLSSSAPPSFYAHEAPVSRPYPPSFLYPSSAFTSPFSGGGSTRPSLLLGRRLHQQASHSLQNSPKHSSFMPPSHQGAPFS
ncbi:hypothetical protein FHG87_015842 [Trinorchestia longiramus]|nr:hypothetical protein FHG87_015842 [Trinorchestia longiramus]